jgi:uncharacterized RDD family membrane protein YckC
MSQYGSPPDPDQPGSTPPTPPGGSGAPQDPYAAPPPAQNPYGSAPQDPYGAPPPVPNPYGGAPAYGGQTAQVPAGGYAGWIKRVAAYLLDGVLGFVAGLPLVVGYVMLFSNATTTTDADGVKHLHLHSSAASVPLIVIGVITSVAFWIWNICIRQGRTGYTIGKGVLGIKLIDENTSQPIGGGMSFLRQIVHILDGFCYLGYLWPLWDRKSQTFADKIMHTVVINQPKAT